MPPILLVAAGLAAGTLLLLVTGRGAFVGAARIYRATVTTVRRAAFTLAVPRRTRKYADTILRVSTERNVSPFILVAIMERESLSGEALRPPGPAGTGDFIPRFRSHQWIARHGEIAFPEGTRVTEDTGVVGGKRVPGKLYSPTTTGWGHGLMQIDYMLHTEFVRSGAWTDPYRAMLKAADILAANVTVIRRALPDLSEDRLAAAALAAYNGGAGRVIALIRDGKNPDRATTGKDYARDVLARADSILRTYTVA